MVKQYDGVSAKRYRGRWYEYANRYILRRIAEEEGKAYSRKHKCKHLVTLGGGKQFPYILWVEQ